MHPSLTIRVFGVWMKWCFHVHYEPSTLCLNSFCFSLYTLPKTRLQQGAPHHEHFLSKTITEQPLKVSWMHSKGWTNSMVPKSQQLDAVILLNLNLLSICFIGFQSVPSCGRGACTFVPLTPDSKYILCPNRSKYSCFCASMSSQNLRASGTPDPP